MKSTLEMTKALVIASLAALLVVANMRAAHGQPATQPPWTDVQIVGLQPADQSVLTSPRPAFSGQFGVPVDPSSLRFVLDGQDVSRLAYASTWEFMVATPADMLPGTHTMEVTGKATNGAPFDRSWSFMSAAGTAQNYLVLTPSRDYANGASFIISGTTMPYSHVRIAAAPMVMQQNSLITAGPGTFVNDVYADDQGQFFVPVYMTQAGPAVIRVLSIDPNSDAGASATLNMID